MLNRVRERIHPQELIQARAAAEAAPLAPRPTPKPLGWGRSAISYLTASAPVERFPHGRFTVAALVPPGHLAVVPLPDPAEAVLADVRTMLAELAPYTAKVEVA